MTPPLVSVIIPTYNRKAYVQQAIDSVLAQTYPHYEIIVVDDGSTDGTGEALAARYGDRITYHWQENQGESAARNWGIDAARGKYIALLDSDDLWLPHKLTNQVEWLECSPDIALLFCLAERIDSNGELLHGPLYGRPTSMMPNTFESLFKTNIGAASTAVISRKVLAQTGGFDESIHYGEDWDLWLRVAAQSGYYCTADSLVRIRIHSEGQWYFPKPQRIAETLNDHLQILEKAYQIWPDKGDNAKLIRKTVLSNRYVQAAVEYYSFEFVQDGNNAIHKALDIDPDIFHRIADVDDSIQRMAFVLDSAHPDDPTVGQRFTTTVNGLIWSTIPKTARASLAVERGYRCIARGDTDEGRRYLLLALRQNPAMFRNRGMMYILMRSIVGDQRAFSIRSLFKTITRRPN